MIKIRYHIIFMILMTETMVSCRQKGNATTPEENTSVENKFTQQPPPSSSPSTLDNGSKVTTDGRRVSLFEIRASMYSKSLMPSLDTLPCVYFKQGATNEIKNIPGGPPVPIPGPIQNHYAGNWNGDSQYNFRVSLWNRIYHDDQIPDWTLEQPKTRTTEYVPKLFDFVVKDPKLAGCTITATRLN